MTEQNLLTQLGQLERETARPLNINRDALLKDFHEDQEHEGTLAMKALSIVGAFFATGLFLVFLFLFGLDSEISLFVLGVLMLVGGYFFCRRDFLGIMGEAFGVALVVCGFPLLLLGFEDQLSGSNDTLIVLLALILAGVLLVLMENGIITFLATVTMGGCLLFLAHDGFDRFGAHLYVGLVAILLTVWVQFEARLLKSADLVCRRYDGVRTGLIFALLIGAGYLSDFRFWMELQRLPNWYASVVLVPLILWLAYGLLLRFLGGVEVTGGAQGTEGTQNTEFTEFTEFTKKTEFTESTQGNDFTERERNEIAPRWRTIRLWLYLAGLLILLLPTIFAPALSATLLCLLLAWKAGYRTGRAIAVLALIYFISRYYYDLNLSLLTKSIILSASGSLFLAAWAILGKKISPDEANIPGPGGH